VNAVLVAALVIINIYYLEVAKRQAEAANAQVAQSQRQADAANIQAEQSRRQGDAAVESLRLLKAEADRAEMQEVVRAIAILQDMKNKLNIWQPIVKQSRGFIPEVGIRFLPPDWPALFLLVSRVLPELREDAEALQQSLGNAEYQVDLYLTASRESRDPNVLPIAWDNLEASRPHLDRLLSALEAHERADFTFKPPAQRAVD
jgi:multidrug efflux pump subunit AcrA (membrane-fusion protein)